MLGGIIAHHMVMIPRPDLCAGRGFHDLGGDLMFGTDVGYMTDYDITDEFRALKQSGLTGADILRTLTTVPAERFGVAREKGTVEVETTGDLVLLDADPMQDVGAFAAVRATVRQGQVIWRRP